MNAWFLAAGIILALITIGHSTGGHRFVLSPMLEADFDPLAKRTMLFVWHLSTWVLAVCSVGLSAAAWHRGAVDYAGAIGTLVGGLAVVHLGTVATSGRPRWLITMPQWVVFATVAALVFAGR